MTPPTPPDFIPPGKPARRAVPDKPLYTLDEAAWLLGVHKNTVRDLVDAGRLGCVREGAKLVWVTRRQLVEYVAGLETEAAPVRMPVMTFGKRRHEQRAAYGA